MLLLVIMEKFLSCICSSSFDFDLSVDIVL